MIHVKIQGKKIRNEDELHKFLKRELNFPDYYGENLNALWDCITEPFGENITIEWLDFSESKRNFGTYAQGESVAEEFVKLFKEAGEHKLVAGSLKLIVQ